MYRYGLCLSCSDYESECGCADMKPGQSFTETEATVFDRIKAAHEEIALRSAHPHDWNPDPDWAAVRREIAQCRRSVLSYAR